jgi:Uma2 family endonuclease
MSELAVNRRYTVEEYLRLERDSLEKHEYDDGEIIAMPGASRIHVLITGNIHAELRSQLRGSACQPYMSDLRLRLQGRPKYVYADVSVICGEPVRDPEDDKGESYMNPRLIVEVLSPSTEQYVRKGKFDRYRKVDSFREYVLVSQDSPRVETFFRQDDGTWTFDVAVGGEADARLRSIGAELLLKEVYAGVSFPTKAELRDSADG